MNRFLYLLQKIIDWGMVEDWPRILVWEEQSKTCPVSVILIISPNS